MHPFSDLGIRCGAVPVPTEYAPVHPNCAGVRNTVARRVPQVEVDPLILTSINGIFASQHS